ncbi:uncharacterized protein EI97DRAFT_497216 [Westerdykella ornata]|uniref:DUF6697 domain-containing protein n=1 Tax=Westerdykella ornata TaxID=318751 RepID=A0A6A6J532_WESOR|nr:uncharacterized protein EI97DRAFT_497216 [Westerdykella ornata]KAF2271502.1 hypothetical protein EI97DRAFT_497216 [Westerdykella ornata]
MPSAVLRFPKLAVEELSIIPSFNDTKSFSLQFLEDTFGGKDWSPGLRIMPPGTGICILPTRSYYLLNADFEPYLPREPGHHGAKLTAFFNEHPATIYGEEANISLDNVPLFVCSTPWAQGNNRRYIYFGNYSQTRWSDKLDYDRMQEYVPLHVKEFWAEELSAQGKDEWVRKALMKHFFPMPEYEGTTFYGQPEGSGANGEEEKVKEKVYRDVKEHVKVLKDWEKDAMLKTRLIKKDFIMKAFERADADEPPALRLWWEYLQCVKYDRKFYDLLVQLQSRKPEYLK